jgi:hypothetical protein
MPPHHGRTEEAERPSAATIAAMADATAPIDERLKEIGAQLDWVRDYL